MLYFHSLSDMAKMRFSQSSLDSLNTGRKKRWDLRGSTLFTWIRKRTICRRCFLDIPAENVCRSKARELILPNKLFTYLPQRLLNSPWYDRWEERRWSVVAFRDASCSPHVYSCFVVNETAEPIECVLKYNGRPGEDDDCRQLRTVLSSSPPSSLRNPIRSANGWRSWHVSKWRSRMVEFWRWTIHSPMFSIRFATGSLMWERRVTLFPHLQHVWWMSWKTRTSISMNVRNNERREEKIWSNKTIIWCMCQVTFQKLKCW